MHDLGDSRDGDASDLTLGYVGGGSRSWGEKFMNELAQAEDLGGEVRLYDVDYESAKENAKLGNWMQRHDDAVSEWEYQAVEDLSDALNGADIVILSTQDPPAETMVHDLQLPREYGIHQTVGDTVGPGGAIRALRAVPQYREIAAAVREHCPDAWVLNHTNPMTVCTRTLYAEYPDIKAFGLCHEVFKGQELFRDLVSEHYDVEDIHRDEISINVKGINHFTWVDEARWQGTNVYPLVEEWIERRADPPKLEPGDLDDEGYYTDKKDVWVDLYERFGILPAAGDRHLVEFVPWYLDIEEPKEIQRWGTRVTPAESRVNYWPESEEERAELLESDEPYEFYETGEEAIDIIEALCGLVGMKTHANVPNWGQCPDLPEGVVVETNVLFTGDEMRQLHAGELPRQVRNMVMTHVNNQETLVEAGFAGDLDLGFQAFLNDPLVAIDMEEARELFARLVVTQREHLDAYDFEDATVLDGIDVEPASDPVPDDD